MNTGLLISAICGIISIILVLGLVFSSRFRRDVLGGQGEATVLGLVTAKGAAIIVLCALFLAGMLYPLFRTNPACDESIGRLSAQLEEKFESQVRHASSEINPDALTGIVDRLRQWVSEIRKSCR